MRRVLVVLALLCPALLGAQQDSTLSRAVRVYTDSLRAETVRRYANGTVAPVRKTVIRRLAARIDSLVKPRPAVVVFLMPPPRDTVVTPAPTPAPTPPPPVVTPPPDPAPPSPPAGSPGGVATLPLRTVDTTTPPAGRIVRITGGLQRALDTTSAGSTLLLAPGTVYTGEFVVTPRPGAGWLTIRGDTACPAGRMTDSLSRALHLPRIRSAGAGATLATGGAVRRLRLQCVVIESAAPVTLINYGIVTLGSTTATSVAALADSIVLDRVVVRGGDSTNTQRCVALNSGTTAIINSSLLNCHARGFDSQAIAGWNGPGPYLIADNTLEGAGEVIMFGGADPRIAGLIPSDITIVGNHVTRPLQWKGAWTIKNLFEMKNGRRLLVEGNVFEHNWADAQQGFAILLKSSNQDGAAPWSQTADVTFRHNVVRCSPAGLTVSAIESPPYDGVPVARVVVEHNLFDQIGACGGTASGRQLMLLGGLTDVVMQHNTLVSNYAGAGAFLVLDGAAGAQRVAVEGNASTYAGPFGAVIGGNGTNGGAALSWYGVSAFCGNVIGGLPASLVPRYPVCAPAANEWPTVLALGTDYILPSGSPYAGRGADLARIRTATAGAVVP